MPDPAANTGGVPFYKHLGMSKAQYRKCKLAYRQGGMKRSMPCYPGARDLTIHIRNAGVQVWICTTRPYLRLDNIDPDTRHWLKRNGIQYDGVLFGEHKYRDLVKILGHERIVAVVDDLPEMMDQALDLGLTACLRTQPYNHGYSRSGNWCRADSMFDIRCHFDKVYPAYNHRRNNGQSTTTRTRPGTAERAQRSTRQ
jgi:hypothetical protein